MFLTGEMCAQEPSECSFMSYDYELAGNLAECNGKKNPEREAKSYQETDDRNATQWNRMKRQTVDAKYTYISSEPNKCRTEIIQSMLLSFKERMCVKMLASVCERANFQVASSWKPLFLSENKG